MRCCLHLSIGLRIQHGERSRLACLPHSSESGLRPSCIRGAFLQALPPSKKGIFASFSSWARHLRDDRCKTIGWTGRQPTAGQAPCKRRVSPRGKAKNFGVETPFRATNPCDRSGRKAARPLLPSWTHHPDRGRISRRAGSGLPAAAFLTAARSCNRTRKHSDCDMKTCRPHTQKPDQIFRGQIAKAGGTGLTNARTQARKWRISDRTGTSR